MISPLELSMLSTRSRYRTSQGSRLSSQNHRPLFFTPLGREGAEPPAEKGLSPRQAQLGRGSLSPGLAAVL